MSITTIYPKLSDLIPLERLPNGLEGIKDGLKDILDEVYVKDLIISKSYLGDTGFYSLKIVAEDNLGFDIPFGSGLRLAFNPGNLQNTEIPISFNYSWRVLKYIKNFSTSSFDNAVDSILGILFDLIQVEPSELLQDAIFEFYPSATLIEDFTQDFNRLNGESIQIVDESLTDFQKTDLLFEEIENRGYDTLEIVYQTIINVEGEDALERLQRLFSKYLSDIDQTIKEILEIQFRASINEISLGLQFPRKWLSPVYTGIEPVDGLAINDPLPEEYLSTLKYNAGQLVYSNENGFEFDEISDFSFTRSEIGNTGIIAEFDGLKLDLSNNSNLPEAIADGRSEDFKGVYAASAAITLPKKWFQKNDDAVDTVRISGYNLLIGNGGLSGTIGFEALLNNGGSITNYHQDNFTLQYPVSAKRVNPITSQLETVNLANHDQLVTHYNLGNKINFIFPISLTDTRSGEIRTFTDVVAYQQYLVSVNPTVQPRIGFKIGNFELGLTAFDVTFSQGSIVATNILGLMKIPGLNDALGNPAEVIVTGHLDDEGNLRITVSEADGLQLKIPGVANLFVHSLAYARNEGRGYVEIAADLQFDNGVISKILCNPEQRIPLPTMRFYADPVGFEIVGGSIAVPESFSLCLGPVDISVTGINMGSYQREHEGTIRKYKYWGFDGAISVNPLGIDVKGDGVKFYHTIDDEETGLERDAYVHIQALGIDLMIPANASPREAAVIIKGYLSLPVPGESPEYEGAVTAKIGKMGITGSAAMRLAPKHPAFILDADLELKTGIPIGASGLEITGFRGLFGYRYVAEKEAVGLTSGNTEDTWYDYYVYPKRGINQKKFNTPDKTGKYENPVSVGAGVTITTQGPNVVSARVMFLLSIPSLFVLDGRASIISREWGLDDSGEPPFFAFLAIGDQSIEVGIGADFKIPQRSGILISVQASVQAAFFFRDPSAWYLHVGTKEQPNEGKVLNLLTAQCYLELSAKGIELGARAEFLFNKRFGPAKVKAWLFAEVGGKLSFERPQIGGYLEVGGGLEISIAIISAGISFNALLAVEAPKPFLIRAEVRVCARVKIGFVRINKCVNVEIKWEFNKRVDRNPVLPYPKSDPAATDQIQGIHMLTGETFNLVQLTQNSAGNDASFDEAILPLDTYIDIKFLKGLSISDEVKDLIGGVNNPPVDNIELIPPEKTVKGGHTVRQVWHHYSIEKITLEAWTGTSWVKYNPYEAVTAKDETTDNFSELKIGHWQKTRKAYDQIKLLASSPFTYTEQGEAGWYVPEEIGITPSTYFCEGSGIRPRRVSWLSRTKGERYHVPFLNPQHFFNLGPLFFQILGTGLLGDEDFVQPEFGEVASEYSNFDFAQSLKIPNTNSIALKFTNSAQTVSLKVSSTARGVRFRFYQAIFEETEGTPVVSYQLIPGGEIYKLSSELYDEFTFSSNDYPIDRVEIDPETENEEEIDRIREEIATLLEKALASFSPNPSATLDQADQDRYDLLASELEEARSIGCDMGIPPPRGIGAMQIGGQRTDGTEIDGTLIVGVDAFGNEEEIPPPINGETNKCFTLLHEVGWLTLRDWISNEEIPGQEEIEADFRVSVEAISQVASPIWRPDTSYRIGFTVADKVDNKQLHEFPYLFGFKTAGPLGHYHNAPKVTYGGDRDNNGILIDPDKYAITGLRNYIDYQRSYPNANGSLLNAKPLFYGSEGGNNEIKLFFNKPYLNHMLDNWGAFGAFGELTGKMEVIIKDPTEDVTFSNPPAPDEVNSEIASTTGVWETDGNPQLPEHLSTIQNLLDGLNNGLFDCKLTLGEKIIPKSYNSSLQINDLKPQKLYNAIVNSHYKNKVVQVHAFNFQTSRYPNFAEQINSYQLKDENGEVTDHAIYDLPVTATIDQINEAYELVAQEIVPAAEAAEIDPFDRAIEGLLGIKPLDPAATTEFNLLKNEEGNVIGILIRNPEPFNNPNTPREVIAGTKDPMKDRQAIAVLRDGVAPDPAFKVLHAKDYAQCLIMKRETMGNEQRVQITDTQCSFRFQFLTWDGNDYSAQEINQIITPNLSINNQ